MYSPATSGIKFRRFAAPAGIAVDSSGNAYVTGTTSSGDFPVNAGDVTLGSQDAFVAKVIEEAAEFTGIACGNLINLFNPEVIVLGGGLSNLDRLYANVPRLWAPHVFSDTVVTRLLKARHGDSSGVRGAAWLWSAPLKPTSQNALPRTIVR